MTDKEIEQVHTHKRRSSDIADNENSIFCFQHQDLISSMQQQTEAVSDLRGDMKVIKNSLETIASSLTDGRSTSRNTIMAFVGLTVGIFIQIIIFASLWGSLKNQVEINTARLTSIENRLANHLETGQTK